MTPNDPLFIGVNDHDIDLFEGQFEVPNGMSYNSYIIIDEKIAVMDSVDARFSREWLSNLERALSGKQPDYLIVHHMEPDHSGSILQFMEAYPNATIVTNNKGAAMMMNFFGTNFDERCLLVKNGDELSLGSQSLTFIFAPMVHWPEVMMSYNNDTKTLYSADAFGKFGALDTDEEWAHEARRYYFGIVAPYGKQVQALLKKVAAFDIKAICPLHGPMLYHDLASYLSLYETWSNYEPESDGIVIAYASVYGHTKKAAEDLAALLERRGSNVTLYDLARCDQAAAISDAFRYKTLVCASVTYNGSLFPAMRNFLHDLAEKKYQNHRVAFIQNGAWAPMATKAMKGILESCNDLSFIEEEVTLTCALNDASQAELEELAAALA